MGPCRNWASVATSVRFFFLDKDLDLYVKSPDFQMLATTNLFKTGKQYVSSAAFTPRATSGLEASEDLRAERSLKWNPFELQSRRTMTQSFSIRWAHLWSFGNGIPAQHTRKLKFFGSET